MVVYIVIWALTTGCCLYAGTNRKKEVVCSFVLLFVMMMMCGLRGLECGTDNINYLRIFQTQYYDSPLEVGFIASYKLVPNFQLWLFLYALFSYAILFCQLKKETVYCCLGVLIYMISTTKFFPESFNIIRQVLAASIMLWAFVAWQHSKKAQALLGIVIATAFHTSSVIALPFFLLKYMRFPFWLAASGLVFTVALGMAHVINDVLQLFALGFSEFNSADATADIAAKYSSYGGDTSFLNAKAMLTNTVPITAMALLTYPFSAKAKEAYGFYYNVFFVTTMIGNIFIPAMVYGFRLVFSLQIVQVLVLPLAYQHHKKAGRQLLVCYLLFLSVVYFYYLYTLTFVGVRTIVPFRFIDDIQFVLDSFR